MRLTEIAKIVLAVLGSLGGGGAIVLGLSSWLGKLWAERLMETEKARHQKELEDFKAQLERESDRSGQTLREKLALYKEAIAPIVDLITQLEQTAPESTKSSQLAEFDRKRLATTSIAGHVRRHAGVRRIQQVDRLPF